MDEQINQTKPNYQIYEASAVLKYNNYNIFQTTWWSCFEQFS